LPRLGISGGGVLDIRFRAKKQELLEGFKDSYCQNGLGAESRSGQEIRKKSKKVDIYAILGMVLSQNSIPHPQDDTKR
jgi:hypothetical protein